MSTRRETWISGLTSVIVRYDPYMAAASAIGSVAGGFMQAGQYKDQGNRYAQMQRDQGFFERDYFNFQAVQEEIALGRDLDAARTESQATMSRSRAIMAGQGGGMDTDLLARDAQGFARQEMSLIQDSEARRMALRTKAGRAEAAALQSASYTLMQSDNAASNAIFKGFSGSLPGFTTLYKEAKSA
jgi:hypothetical protein